MMGEACNHHLSGLRKNGDERSTAAAPSAATAVDARLFSAVSHAERLEASATDGAPTAGRPALGPPAGGCGPDAHDLGGRRFPSREIRDRTRLLRGLLRRPQTTRQNPRGLSEGAAPHPPAAVA